MKQAITKILVPFVLTSGLFAQTSNNSATLYNISSVAGSVPSGQGNGGPANQALLLEADAVAVDPAGNIYVSDTVTGRVRKVAAGTGIISNYFTPGTSIFGLTTDAQGNVYMAVTGWHAIVECGPNCNPTPTAGTLGSGGYVFLAGNSGRNSGFDGDGGKAVQTATGNLRELNSPHGVAVDSAGNIYIADTSNNRIRRVDSAGIIHTIAGTGASTAPIIGGTPFTCAAATDSVGDGCPATQAILNGPWSVMLDPAGTGNIYIVDTGNNRIRLITASSGIITSVAGNGMATALTTAYTGGATNLSLGDGQTATSATFKTPFYMAIDANANMYVSDNGNTRVRKISNTGLISSYTSGSTTSNGLGSSTSFAAPRGLAFDLNGNLLIADGVQVKTVDQTYLVPTAVIGRAAFAGDGGNATSALLNGSATGLAVDTAGNLYISDAGNNRIREVSGGVISTILGSSVMTFGGDAGPAAYARINSPGCVAVDANNSIYFADRSNNRIRKLSGGIVSTIVGPSLGQGQVNNYPVALLSAPQCVAVDNQGNVYFTEGNSVQKLTVASNTVSVIAGQPSFNGNLTTSQTLITGLSTTTTTTVTGTGTLTGPSGAAGDGTLGTNSLLNAPAGLAVDTAGNVYIADKGNNSIREVSAVTGIITTIAGVASTTGGDTSSLNSMTGAITTAQPAFGARLNAPQGVAVDITGNIYIANTGNGNIEKIDTNGNIISIGGGGANLAELGPGVSTQALSPTAIAVDNQGNVYFGDRIGLVRKLTPVPASGH